MIFVMLMNMLLVYYFYIKLIIFYLKITLNLKEQLVNESIDFLLLRVQNRKYLKYFTNKIIYISNNLFIISSIHILFNTNIYNYLIYNNNVNSNIINMYTYMYTYIY